MQNIEIKLSMTTKLMQSP